MGYTTNEPEVEWDEPAPIEWPVFVPTEPVVLPEPVELPEEVPVPA